MLVFAALLSASQSSSARAQAAKPYSLGDIVDLLAGGVPTAAIAKKVKTSCIAFRMNDTVVERLRGEGAGADLIGILRTTCYRPLSRDDPTDKPTVHVIDRTVVKHDTVVIRPTVVDVEKATRARAEIPLWQQYLLPNNSDYNIGYTIDTLAKLYTISGDSLSSASVYAAILANPSAYGELALLHAGVVATRIGRYADAVTLNEEARRRNPISSDALYNLAWLYHSVSAADKMLDMLNDATRLEPNRADARLLFAHLYQLRSQLATDPRLRRAYQDSTAYYLGIAQNLPVKVEITMFTRGSAKTELSGLVENRTGATRTFTLDIDFLNQSGGVVASREVIVGPVTVNGSQAFNVSVPDGGVYGFRYKPVR